VKREYGYDTIKTLDGVNKKFDTVILAVSHNEFASLDLNDLTGDTSVIYDVKGFLDRNQVDGRL